MATRTLSRRVVFYGWEDVEGTPAFERVRGARAIENLPDAAWALEEADGFVTGAIVDRPGTANAPTCLRFFRLRSGDDLPHVLNARHQASPLQLAQNEAVTDWTHVVIWPDHFAAHDSRRDAPTLSRLRTYLHERGNEHVRFFPLYDRSLIDQLDELDDIKALDIKFQVSEAEQLDEADRQGMIGGLLAVGHDADAVTVETRVSVGRSRARYLSQRIRGEVHELAEHAEDILDKLVITGVRDGQTVEIDVLRRRLDDDVRVRRSRRLGNAPDPNMMYSAILDSRRDIEADGRLGRAVRMR